jgi:hypothetical protein
LNITIDAPIIIVPQNSSSSNALYLDCGIITVKTNMEILKNYYKKENLKINIGKLNDRCGLPPLLEVQKVILSNMVVSRVVLKDDLKILSNLSLIDCSELKVVVKRSLQPKVFKDVEAIFVEAIYGGLLVSLSKSDYTFIIELLQNLNEKFINTDKDLEFFLNDGKDKKLKRKRSHASTSSLQDIKNILDIEEKTNKKAEDLNVPNISIKLYIDSVRMYLHDKESKMVIFLIN